MPAEPKPFRKKSIAVSVMAEEMRSEEGVDLEQLNDVDASEREVVESILHRPGLALAGFVELFTYQRVQILGNTENQYLEHLSPEARRAAFENLIQFGVPCLILTHGNRLDGELMEQATDAGIPVYCTAEPTTNFMARLREYLRDQFALQIALHGSLVDVYGVGLLLMGKPGIGKSEVALDLVERGHRLVADDVVMITRKDAHTVEGTGTDLVQHFMEVRGLGLVDVRAMFGIRAIRFNKRVDVVLNMHLWDPEEEYTRLGMTDDEYDILDVKLPLVKIPLTPGKNITVLCEVIAMNHLLRKHGYDPAEVFAGRLQARIQAKREEEAPDEGVEYFGQDSE